MLQRLFAFKKLLQEKIEWLLNFLALVFVYPLGIGLTSFFAKVFQKRFLDRDVHQKSFWREVHYDDQSNTHMF
ncbi:MAG: hypothetical protein ABI425_02930 [Patescibacteria group bacterium]